MPSSVVAQFTEIIDTYNLTKEQLIKMYDDHIAQKLESASTLPAEQNVTDDPMEEDMCASGDGVMVTVCEAGADVGVREGGGPVMFRDTPPPLTSVVEETNSSLPGIGQKRKHFTLEEELKVQVSSFVEALLEYVERTH